MSSSEQNSVIVKLRKQINDNIIKFGQQLPLVKAEDDFKSSVDIIVKTLKTDVEQLLTLDDKFRQQNLYLKYAEALRQHELLETRLGGVEKPVDNSTALEAQKQNLIIRHRIEIDRLQQKIKELVEVNELQTTQGEEMLQTTRIESNDLKSKVEAYESERQSILNENQIMKDATEKIREDFLNNYQLWQQQSQRFAALAIERERESNGYLEQIKELQAKNQGLESALFGFQCVQGQNPNSSLNAVQPQIRQQNLHSCPNVDRSSAQHAPNSDFQSRPQCPSSGPIFNNFSISVQQGMQDPTQPCLANQPTTQFTQQPPILQSPELLTQISRLEHQVNTISDNLQSEQSQTSALKEQVNLQNELILRLKADLESNYNQTKKLQDDLILEKRQTEAANRDVEFEKQIQRTQQMELEKVLKQLKEQNGKCIQQQHEIASLHLSRLEAQQDSEKIEEQRRLEMEQFKRQVETNNSELRLKCKKLEEELRYANGVNEAITAKNELLELQLDERTSVSQQLLKTKYIDLNDLQK